MNRFAVPVVLLAAAAVSLGWWILAGSDRAVPDRGVVRPADDRASVRPGASLDRPADSSLQMATGEPGGKRSVTRRRADSALDLGAVGEMRQRLLGLVLSGSGPIPGAQVFFTTAEGEVLVEATSDERGNFELHVPRPLEDGLLVVRARGYAPLETGPHRVRRGEKRYLGNIRLTSGLMLSGRVVSPMGSAVPGARVLLRAGGPGGGFNRYVQRALSDGKGFFRFPAAPTGMARVEAFGEGYGSRSLELRHDSAQDHITVALVAELALVVHVRRPDGAPVPHAKILMRPSDPRSPNIEGVTDEAGACYLGGLGSANWELRVSAAGYRPAVRPKAQADGNPITVELDPWPCVFGRVSVPGGAALPTGTTVLPLSANARGGFIDSGRYAPLPVAPDGSFEICDMRPGIYAIRASAPGFAPTLSVGVRLTLRGDARNLAIKLRAGGRLRLKARSGKSPCAGARVAIYDTPPPPGEEYRDQTSPLPASPVQPLATATTDAAGQVSFPHLTQGQYWCLIRPRDLLPTIEGPIHVQDGRLTEAGPVRLQPGGRLSGSVKDARGKGQSGVVVLLIGEGTRRAPIQLQANEEGRWESPLLPPGIYRVTARVVYGAPAATKTTTANATVVKGKTEELELTL